MAYGFGALVLIVPRCSWRSGRWVVVSQQLRCILVLFANPVLLPRTDAEFSGQTVIFICLSAARSVTRQPPPPTVQAPSPALPGDVTCCEQRAPCSHEGDSFPRGIFIGKAF